jgi:hypothetical protein
MFTCRAKPPNQDNLELGKLTAGFRGCAIGYYGASLSVESYQVLMSYSTRWVNATGTGLPAHAVEGGARPDGVAEYVCRATPPGARGLHPGKRSDRTCDVEFGGREYNVEKFQVLTYPWTRARRGAIPARAFQASSDVDGSPLYPCRGQHLGGLHLGKVGTHLQGCLIESFGRSVLLPAYEVLTSFAGNWIAGFGGSSPDNGFIGGIEINPEGPGTLDQYVCRAIPPGAGNTKHPGKFVPRPQRPNSGRCWVEFGHSGYALDAYEVLVPTNARFSPR